MNKPFELEVKVFDENNRRYIEDAQISVNSFITYKSDSRGIYTVKARLHDELVVRHPDFKTVYHIINSQQSIQVRIKKIDKKKESFFKNSSKKEANYLQFIDSAKFYSEKNIDKSLSFIEELLKSEQSKSRHANTYKVLADIYVHWKQYDIAITNFKTSLRIYEKVETRLQLAKAQYLAKAYDDSEQTYIELKTNELSNYERVQVFHGLADVYYAKNEFDKAKSNYEKGLEIAEKHGIREEIPDLNTEIANIYAREGNLSMANSRISKTLEQVSELDAEPSLKIQQEVADFYNKTEQYDNEIQLRKEILENVDKSSRNNSKRKKQYISTDEDKIDESKDSLTSQKLNYKIGNAYVLKENYDEAINYLKKSIIEANRKEDFEVKKHATRKLSEVYDAVGSKMKALKTYKDFVEVVDALYIKKEQEIYQSQRLSKKIAENQSRIAILIKEKELTESRLSLAYKENELSNEKDILQQVIIYSLLLGLVLMSLLSYYSYRANQKQKLANNLLALKSMRSQMNPHFIFNALNSVNSFIAVNDERNANRYLSEFSVLMRSVLENSDEDFIPFTKEIELLELYVKLEHNRFQDKFDYTIDVDSSINLEEYKIPPMLLQPYIENAIWHGLRYKKDKGVLKIAVKQEENDAINITIEDNGIGRKKSMEMKTKNQLKQKSKGMSTIKNRIAILNDMYQDKVAVLISDCLPDGSGTKVELTLKK
ncbi:tetratricopeptide repeat-containing sensor histidine kinase [Tenacibaculum sp. SZ-18]|uniref:tetratricopeptide repeat-containing sensor histidine kinase n=1 Tax=Tenacibaculum sp. SZ-18 TaxID=754423 RepID=UPI0012FD14F5|nr:histidine kinase [Tenacibaculum sp. SZ-18]